MRTRRTGSGVGAGTAGGEGVGVGAMIVGSDWDGCIYIHVLDTGEETVARYISAAAVAHNGNGSIMFCTTKS